MLGAVRSGPTAQCAVAVQRDVHRPEWCSERVAGGLAHRFLAGPERQHALSLCIGVEGRDRAALVARQELARNARDVDSPIQTLDVDADPASPGGTDDRDTRGVGDVEIECRSAGKLGSPAGAADDLDRRGICAAAAGDNRAQRAASHHVAIAQARIAEAGRAVAFGRRQPLLVRVETRRDGRDLAPPELGVRFGGRKDLDTGRCAFGIAARPVLL